MNGLLDLLSRPFRRQPRSPLAARRPGRGEMGQLRSTPLGMEALDMKLIDRVTRTNDTLERTHNMHTDKSGSAIGRSSTYVEAMPEDETYAARYHRAYNKKDT